MKENLQKFLESQEIEASTPCRIDMGGTLDISTFYIPLRYLSPLTFNIAVDLRTRVRLLPYRDSMIKISSRGFDSAEFTMDNVPYDHPFGLLFATAAYFRAHGVHIDIHSSSPPRGALGGSSSAAVALIAAFSVVQEMMGGQPYSRRQIAWLAHTLESSVAGVPCGHQDQLAAVYGGVNAWHWPGDVGDPLFRKTVVVKETDYGDLKNHLLLAYCGVPHASKDINGKWVRQFLSGKYHKDWTEITSCTHQFVKAISERNFADACASMNRETAIRRKMTPDVLESLGAGLVDAAVGNGCGARFTGAGGGGCIWALGNAEDIDKLRGIWERILSTRKDAGLLDVSIASQGVSTGS